MLHGCGDADAAGCCSFPLSAVGQSCYGHLRQPGGEGAWFVYCETRDCLNAGPPPPVLTLPTLCTWSRNRSFQECAGLLFKDILRLWICANNATVNILGEAAEKSRGRMIISF